MKDKIKILLIDDNENDNYFHQRVIKKAGLTGEVAVAENGLDALKYLINQFKNIDSEPVIKVTLIFLDINMPKMGGFEFLDEYCNLDNSVKAGVVVIMLSTSENPKDVELCKQYTDVKEYCTKPLTIEKLQLIINKHFIT